MRRCYIMIKSLRNPSFEHIPLYYLGVSLQLCSVFLKEKSMSL